MELRPKLRQASEKVFETTKSHLERIERERPIRRLAGAILLLLGFASSEAFVRIKIDQIDEKLKQRFKSEQNAKTVPAKLASAVLKVDKAPMGRTPQETARLDKAEVKRQELARTKEAIGRVNLSLTGYVDFLAHDIDKSHMAYAQTFKEFNPDRVPIKQDRTKHFIWHYTANPVPQGGSDIDLLIRGMANRTEGKDKNGKRLPDIHRCCAVNWAIGRDGVAYQLAPKDAKLRHDPPNDNLKTGVEVAALYQSDITTEQYESLAYLTLAITPPDVLQNAALFRSRVLGHGEDRTRWNAKHPGDRYDIKIDFNTEPSSWLRDKILDFVDVTPQLLTLPTSIK